MTTRGLNPFFTPPHEICSPPSIAYLPSMTRVQELIENLRERVNEQRDALSEENCPSLIHPLAAEGWSFLKEIADNQVVRRKGIFSPWMDSQYDEIGFAFPTDRNSFPINQAVEVILAADSNVWEAIQNNEKYQASCTEMVHCITKSQSILEAVATSLIYTNRLPRRLPFRLNENHYEKFFAGIAENINPSKEAGRAIVIYHSEKMMKSRGADIRKKAYPSRSWSGDSFQVEERLESLKKIDEIQKQLAEDMRYDRIRDDNDCAKRLESLAQAGKRVLETILHDGVFTLGDLRKDWEHKRVLIADPWRFNETVLFDRILELEDEWDYGVSRFGSHFGEVTTTSEQLRKLSNDMKTCPVAARHIADASSRLIAIALSILRSESPNLQPLNSFLTQKSQPKTDFMWPSKYHADFVGEWICVDPKELIAPALMQFADTCFVNPSMNFTGINVPWPPARYSPVSNKRPRFNSEESPPADFSPVPIKRHRFNDEQRTIEE